MIKFLTFLCRFAGVVAGLLLFVTAISITIETIARYAGSPTSWAVDVAVLCMIVAGFLSPAAIMLDDAHVRVDVLVSKLSEQLQKRLVRLTLSGAVIYVVVLAWTGADMAIESFRTGMMSTGLFRFPLWASQIAIPIGGVLLLVALFIRIRDVKLTHIAQEVDEHFKEV